MARALLEPVAAGQTRYRMQGLFADARGIAVGRDALAVFESFDQLVAFLGAYSDEASLDDLISSLTVERCLRDVGGQAFLLRCSVADSYSVDRIARLAAFVRGNIYIGANSVFLRWRERKVPFGYDLAVSVSELGGIRPDSVLVVDNDFATRFASAERMDPSDLVLRLGLRPVPISLAGTGSDSLASKLREMTLVLVAPGLGSRVISYLWNREVAFSAAKLAMDDGEQASVLLRLRNTQIELCEVLRKIPGVELFVAVSNRAAVELGWQHPINLATASGCLPGEDMYLFRGSTDRVERIPGAPRFIDARHLVRSSSSNQIREIGELRGRKFDQLAVELILKPSGGLREPRATLVPWEQLELLRKFVYLVPPVSLAAARLVPLDCGLLIMSGSTQGGARRVGRMSEITWSAADMPAGAYMPLGRRFYQAAPGVLVPDGFEISPRLRPELIRMLLGLEDADHALFLDPEQPPLRIRADRMLLFDAAVVARLNMEQPHLIEPELPALSSGKIENRRLGRFALWGFRGGTSES